MREIINIYWFMTDNIGDKMSGVSSYFNFPLPVRTIDIKQALARKDELKDKFIILGGGGHIHLPSLDYNNQKFEFLEEIATLSPWTVIWGLGNNIHNTKTHLYPKCLDDYMLVGLRDLDSPYEYVPCPSCMSPYLDHSYQDVVSTTSFIFKHKFSENFISADSYLIPYIHLCENETSMQQVINKMKRAHTIFTDSYHGAYWGLLLNKTVVVPNPYSSKFYSLHPNLIIKGEKQKGHIEDMSNYLSLCRQANISFYAKVLEKVFEYGASSD